jgi:hypothetical protein
VVPGTVARGGAFLPELAVITRELIGCISLIKQVLEKIFELYMGHINNLIAKIVPGFSADMK